ncbi:unnamed protein product [Brugia timori]|uniref:Ovule protein n=1 Tax=Brugia timori TaxID=42155 RepID=A0A0R3Q4R7_9BILA|nr:unnamed protein product [Brugia timori]
MSTNSTFSFLRHPLLPYLPYLFPIVAHLPPENETDNFFLNLLYPSVLMPVTSTLIGALPHPDHHISF